MSREMEIHEGVVLSVGPGRAVVRLDKDGADGGDCGVCALKRLCRDREEPYVDVPVALSGGETAHPGNRVRVAYKPASPAKAAVILFLPPLAALLLGGWLANALFGVGDGIFLAGTVCGIAAGFALAHAFNRVFKAGAPAIRLVEPDAAE